MYIYMCHNFFIHSPVSGHLGCLPVLVIVKNVAMNIGMHVFSGYMPRVGIARALWSPATKVQDQTISQ